MADINLTSSVRTNLLELNRTEKLTNRTTERLASGKDVNSAIDNPTNFFASISLSDRAEGLNARLDGIGQAIQTVKTAQTGVDSVRQLIANMEAVINQAFEEIEPDARREYGKQFNELMEQAQELLKDSSYAGVNLLQDNEVLPVQFSERFDQSVLRLQGINIQGPGIGGTGVANDAGEVPPSDIAGQLRIASAASAASSASVSSVASQAAVASRASESTSGSSAFVASIASASSVASQPSIASQGAVAASGTIPSQASRAAVASVSSQASIASRPSIASQASAASLASVASQVSIASRASIASEAAKASAAAQTIVQQFAFTLDLGVEDQGTSAVLGVKSHGRNSTELGGHEIDWGSSNFKDTLRETAIELEKMDNALQVELSNLASNISVLTIREEFTTELMSTLNTGSDKLVLADMNVEGANLLALQTRQQIGLEALTLATDTSRQVLRLLG